LPEAGAGGEAAGVEEEKWQFGVGH
jgi:hypothetical protein